MDHKPDSSLPRTVWESLTPPGEGIRDYALYALCEISDADLQIYRRKCLGRPVTAPDSSYLILRPPPQAHFPGRPLSDVVEYHLQLARIRQFHPLYFMICVYPEATTTLVVTLDDQTVDFKPDCVWINLNKWPSGTLAGLQIGHITWEEMKEADVGKPLFPGDTPPYDGPSRTWESIQIYAVEGVDLELLAQRIQPHRSSPWKLEHPNKPLCQPKRIPAGDAPPSRHAADMHPTSCAEDPVTLKNYFIVADVPDFMAEGVQIVHLEWDGILTGRTQEELLDIGREAPLQIQRGLASWNSNDAAIHRIPELAEGKLPWQAYVHPFCLYSRHVHMGFDVDLAIDPLGPRRAGGHQRLLFNPPIDLHPRVPVWLDLLRQHIKKCRFERFNPDFTRQFFIWNGIEQPTEETLMHLVKIEWDGDLSSAVEARLVKNWRAVMTKREAMAFTAHRVLSDVVDGKRQWDGTAIQD